LPPPGEAALGAAAFLVGAIIGSFLAAVLIRWPQGRSAARGRSACDSCGAALSPVELVPILSYFVARGRCRRCGGRIDRRHLAVEAGAAVISLTAFLAHPMPTAITTAALCWWLFLLAALDVEHPLLPDRLTLPLLAGGLGGALLGIGPDPTARLIGAAAGFLSLAGMGCAYRLLRGREGLGGGDPTLLAALGAWLGWQQLPFILLAAGLIGIAHIVGRRLSGHAMSGSDALPLGTLMAIAAWPLWLVAAQ